MFRLNTAEQVLIENHQFSRMVIDQASLRILNWNIAKNNHRHEWLQDFSKLVEWYPPDLIFLQEFRFDSTLKKPFYCDAMSWQFAPNMSNPYTDQHFGVLTASKVKHKSGKSFLTQACEPFLKTPKVSLITEYSLSGSKQTLLAVNIHGINFVSTRKFQSQLQQLEAQLTIHPGPIILSGDFNTWNEYRMKVLQTMVRRLDLRQVTFSSVHYKNLKQFFDYPLDHIFYRGFTQCLGSEIVLGEFSSSDHSPLVVELMLH